MSVRVAAAVGGGDIGARDGDLCGGLLVKKDGRAAAD
jgi:hypothetical protein